LKRKIKYCIIVFYILLAWIVLPAKSSCKAPLTLHGRYDYSQGWYHRVQKGDTLDKLAKQYDRPKTLIARVNGLNPQKSLQEGWYLYIPPSESNPPKVVAKPSVVPPKPPSSTVISSTRVEQTPKKEQESTGSRSPAPSSSSGGDTEKTSSPAINRKVSSRGFIWPVSGKLTKAFTDKKTAPHKGIDISAKKGTTVLASNSGKVIYSDDEIPGYGKLIIIDHGDEITSVYAHNSELLVKAGKYVNQGAPIARVGDTGRASGPHLHFEIRRNAIPVNPTGYLP
jgi:murein DD-endopeptidase MepM/ murein hydrolase activator NlpD